ncbi:MAG: hypothetical protein AAB912_01180, partial [Patescibacteria group bacterium]
MREAAATAGRFVTDRVFPLHCLGCEKEGTWVCGACEDALLFFPAVWQEGPAPLAGVTAVYSYDQPVAHAVIHTLKYQYAEGVMTWMVPAIERWCAESGAEMMPADAIIVPVPLHRKRYAERGFNQAALIAVALGRALGLPVLPLLLRKRVTAPQVAQTRLGRLQNVADAFVLNQRVCQRAGSFAGNSIIIVDDVT